MRKYGCIYLDSKTNTYYLKSQAYTKDGKLVYITKRGFKTKSEALSYKMSKIESIKNTYAFEIDNPNITFHKFLDLYLEDYALRHVQESYYGVNIIITKYIKPQFKDCKLSSLKPSMFRKFSLYIADLEYTSKRKNDILNRLKDIINSAIKRSYIDFKIGNIFLNELINVVDDGHMIKNDYWTQEEYHKFISVIPYNTQYYYLFQTLFNLGCRIGELRALKWKDLNETTKTILIHSQVKSKSGSGHWEYVEYTKTKQSREVLISDHLLNLLLELKQRMNYQPEHFMFFGNSPKSENAITQAKKKYCLIAGVKYIRNHDFRHSYTTYLKDSGVETKTISKQLGHANVSVTENVYNHVSEIRNEKLLKVLNKIEEEE